MTQASLVGQNGNSQLRIPTVDCPGWIYVIADPSTGWAKVGWSDTPDRRFRQIQGASAAQLTRVGLMPGSRAAERMLHAFLEIAGFERRRGSEWFRLYATENRDTEDWLWMEGFDWQPWHAAEINRT